MEGSPDLVVRGCPFSVSGIDQMSLGSIPVAGQNGIFLWPKRRQRVFAAELSMIHGAKKLGFLSAGVVQGANGEPMKLRRMKSSPVTFY